MPDLPGESGGDHTIQGESETQGMNRSFTLVRLDACERTRQGDREEVNDD